MDRIPPDPKLIYTEQLDTCGIKRKKRMKTEKRKKVYLGKSVNDFPPEVLGIIFNYLEDTRDRKSAKLVCSYWYDILSVKPFSNNEVFIIDANKHLGYEENYLESLMSTLVNSKRKTFNFELMYVSLNQEMASFEVCGPRIHSLALLSCTYLTQSVVSLIRHCTNLEELIITYEEKQIHKMLVKLISGYHKNSNLKTIKLCRKPGETNSKDFEMIRDIFRLLFQVFPSLSSIEVELRIPDYHKCFKIEELSCEECMSMIETSLSVDEILTRNQVHSLKFDFRGFNNFTLAWRTERNIMASLQPLIKVTDLIINASMLQISFESVIRFIKNRCDLQTLKFVSTKHTNFDELEPKLLKILKKCPDLSVFHFSSTGSIILYKKLFKYSSKSQIKEISLRARGVISFAKKFKRNNTLEALTVNFRVPSSREMNAMSTLAVSLVSLKKLTLCTVTCNLFRDICKSLRSLEELTIRTLHCEGLKRCPRYFTCINLLEKLQVLRLPTTLAINPEGISLPYLREFEIISTTTNETKHFHSMTEKFFCPAVEVICFNCENSLFYMPIWLIPFVSTLKKLRCLGIQPRKQIFVHDGVLIPDDDVERIFKLCPHMEYIHCWNTIYFYDKIRKMFTVYASDCDYRRTFKSIGDFRFGSEALLSSHDDSDDDSSNEDCNSRKFYSDVSWSETTDEDEYASDQSHNFSPNQWSPLHNDSEISDYHSDFQDYDFS